VRALLACWGSVRSTSRPTQRYAIKFCLVGASKDYSIYLAIGTSDCQGILADDGSSTPAQGRHVGPEARHQYSRTVILSDSCTPEGWSWYSGLDHPSRMCRPSIRERVTAVHPSIHRNYASEACRGWEHRLCLQWGEDHANTQHVSLSPTSHFRWRLFSQPRLHRRQRINCSGHSVSDPIGNPFGMVCSGDTGYLCLSVLSGLA